MVVGLSINKQHFSFFFQIGVASEMQEVMGWDFLESPCGLFFLCLNLGVMFGVPTMKEKPRESQSPHPEIVEYLKPPCNYSAPGFSL